MGFRVGTSAAYLIFKRSLGLANQKQVMLSEQLATGKRVNRLSDDPINAQAIMAFKENLSRLGQFERNVNFADSRWKQIESEMGSINDLLVRARDLAVQGNNGTLGATEREAIAREVHQLSEQLLAIANKQVNGEYIFAGYKTDTRPYEWDPAFPDATPAATFNGDSNLKRIEIGEDQWFEIQVRGDHLFQGDGSADQVDLMQTLANLEQALLTNNVDDDDPASVGQALEDLGLGLTQIQGEMANVGAKAKRLENTKENLADQKLIAQTFLQQNEEIDFAEVAYEFQRAQVVLQATVSSAGAMLNRPSLMDFLR